MRLPEKFEILIITLSDRAHSGVYEDLSGPMIRELLSAFFTSESWTADITLKLIPDDRGMLEDLLTAAKKECDLVITSGGTGIGPRDITVETVSPFITKEIPGVMEFIRVKYGMEKPNALLSRGVAGVMGRSLVYTLPGSVKAVEEYMSEILKTLKHTFYMLYGIDTHSKH